MRMVTILTMALPTTRSHLFLRVTTLVRLARIFDIPHQPMPKAPYSELPICTRIAHTFKRTRSVLMAAASLALLGLGIPGARSAQHIATHTTYPRQRSLISWGSFLMKTRSCRRSFNRILQNRFDDPGVEDDLHPGPAAIRTSGHHSYPRLVCEV
ncbi:uncharacterized protein LY79DRAFT_404217 [Colletotrichum navitas]|uniref:Uncharacterized protein n=1 Tax=Colletotrichum navitas TaxID=681940 RepID=A0AAD8Q6Y3_9PEZI|nr:uncharacterized protein LY79DRAFT_404217 [Colletotrichum navitas]KAK1597068.1 hypothetical protein LY79DRAFT_404217 [Colletotrichum navitas]